jgi:hypothetical protein
MSLPGSFLGEMVYSRAMTRGRFFMLATAAALAALILLAYYFGVR